MGLLVSIWGLLGEVGDIMGGNMRTIMVVWGLLAAVWGI